MKKIVFEGCSDLCLFLSFNWISCFLDEEVVSTYENVEVSVKKEENIVSCELKYTFNDKKITDKFLYNTKTKEIEITKNSNLELIQLLVEQIKIELNKLQNFDFVNELKKVIFEKTTEDKSMLVFENESIESFTETMISNKHYLFC